MLVIGLILNVFGIGLFCWLIFTLAVYALPFFVGLSAAMAAFHSGAGVVGALITRCWHRSADACGRPTRFHRRPALGPPRFHCCCLRSSGSHRRVSHCSRPGAAGDAVYDLARNLRRDRRDPYWRHGVGTYDHSGGAAFADKRKWPVSVRISGPCPRHPATTRMRRERTSARQSLGFRSRPQNKHWASR
jgi:hypothetical protein